MSLELTLRRWHQAARSFPALYRLAIISRLLLALAFVPTALVKVLGQRFTSIGIDTPIGFFFEALYRSGDYWRFIGAAQLVAGLLLLVPRTALLGAVAYFPIILNIFAITVSLQFSGTRVVTGLMLLACLFLLCWDYHRLAALVWGQNAGYEAPALPALPRIERVGYVVGAVSGLGVLFWTRGFALPGAARTMLLVWLACGAAGAALVLAGWWQSARARQQPA